MAHPECVNIKIKESSFSCRKESIFIKRHFSFCFALRGEAVALLGAKCGAVSDLCQRGAGLALILLIATVLTCGILRNTQDLGQKRDRRIGAGDITAYLETLHKAGYLRLPWPSISPV